MKNKLNILVLSAAAIALSSCASSFLDRDPQGNTILQNQYEQLDNTVEGSVRGIYSLLYEYSSESAPSISILTFSQAIWRLRVIRMVGSIPMSRV